jgi:hypothetical protein
MNHPKGELIVTAGGNEYRLHLGISVLADLQVKHGQDVVSRLDPPAGAAEDWLPDLGIIIDMFMGALQRYHSDVADRYLVDDIMAENATSWQDLLQAAFPTPKAQSPGNVKRPKRSA